MASMAARDSADRPAMLFTKAIMRRTRRLAMHAHCRMQLMIEVGLWRTWATHFYAADGENLDMPEMHFEMQSNMDRALWPSPAATDTDGNQSLSVDKMTAVLAALRF